MNLRACTTVGNESVVNDSVLSCGSVTVNLRAYTTVGTGTEIASEVLSQSVLPCGSVQ